MNTPSKMKEQENEHTIHTNEHKCDIGNPILEKPTRK